MYTSKLFEDPFKISIAIRQILVQCHDIQATSPGTTQHTNAHTHTHLSVSFQQVVAICMDIFMTDRQDGGQITSKRSQRRLCIIMPEHRRRTPFFGRAYSALKASTQMTLSPHSHDPNLSGHFCMSMGKSARFIGQPALIVSRLE